MRNIEQKAVLQQSIISHLINLGQADTLYRDVYLFRARFHLEQDLSQESYLGLKQMQTKAAGLPNLIRNAMIHGDWQQVHDLSGEVKRIQDDLERNKSLQELARKVYDDQEIRIDPFSPGMHNISGFLTDRLPALRTGAIQSLQALSRSDNEWKAFYLQRLAVFNDLNINTGNLDRPTQQIPSDILEEEAAQALQTGNMARLEQLAEKLLHSARDSAASTTPAELFEGTHQPPEEYRYKFTDETLKKARVMGLDLYSVPSRQEEYAPYLRFAWHPTYSDLQTNHAGVVRIPELPLPKDLPEALKTRIQLFAMHPFINSAGVRFLPSMVVEDVLVESFPEPEAGAMPPPSGLLEALGLKHRNQLSRQHIEAVLLDKGNALVRDELGLDPKQFKLICIPPDLHLRIGMERGWGQQQIWTHFDGYMILADGMRQALAGGDVRYGGIYDLVGLGCNYDSDRVISRFAVVQRRRMAIWQ